MSKLTLSMSEARNAIHSELNDLLIDSLFTARGNLEAGRLWTNVNRWLGLPASMASAALAGGAGVSALVGDSSNLTAILAFLSAALAAVRGFLKPEEQATAYSTKGNKTLSIRNQSKLLLNVGLQLSELSDERAYSQLRSLREDYDALLLEEPLQIPRWAYNRAKAGIERGESDYVLKRGKGE